MDDNDIRTIEEIARLQVAEVVGNTSEIRTTLKDLNGESMDILKGIARALQAFERRLSDLETGDINMDSGT